MQNWQETFDANNATWEVTFALYDENIRIAEEYKGDDWMISTARAWMGEITEMIETMRGKIIRLY